MFYRVHLCPPPPPVDAAHVECCDIFVLFCFYSVCSFFFLFVSLFVRPGALWLLRLTDCAQLANFAFCHSSHIVGTQAAATLDERPWRAAGGYAEGGGKMTQPNSPRSRPPTLTSFQWSSDAQIAINETALTQAFLYRRRRMEAASRLTDGMLAQVQTIVDADGGPSYMMLLDEVPASADDSQQRRQKDSVCTMPGGDGGAVSVENAMTHATEVLLHDEINRKAQKIRDMRIEQRSAAEMQLKPTFQLVEPSLELSAPPATFTSTSLAFALEALAKSVSKLVAATDGILVRLSVLDKTSQPSIFKDMNILVVHTQHAWRCYAAVMQHLKQYEVCAKALQDGALQELSGMREQFLVCKEMLTAQEPKNKSFLRNTLERCDSG
ncbi:hypothetical protein TRSC58_00707 [Trypanosoma rangeli SC58]|uniref:Uncharacterized protein n=1 Tax=Trypanosoma rangeli SC58 TaxID=429131 RepID=A0A061J9G9_TRYRA|nr:hypothetical protein TRSC58_00707 [Trypanosoma rangeli SC58]